MNTSWSSEYSIQSICSIPMILIPTAVWRSSYPPRNEYKGLRLITPPGPAKSNSSGYSAEC